MSLPTVPTPQMEGQFRTPTATEGQGQGLSQTPGMVPSGQGAMPPQSAGMIPSGPGASHSVHWLPFYLPAPAVPDGQGISSGYLASPSMPSPYQLAPPMAPMFNHGAASVMHSSFTYSYPSVPMPALPPYHTSHYGAYPYAHHGAYPFAHHGLHPHPYSAAAASYLMHQHYARSAIQDVRSYLQHDTRSYLQQDGRSFFSSSSSIGATAAPGPGGLSSASMTQAASYYPLPYYYHHYYGVQQNSTNAYRSVPSGENPNESGQESSLNTSNSNEAQPGEREADSADSMVETRSIALSPLSTSSAHMEPWNLSMDQTNHSKDNTGSESSSNSMQGRYSESDSLPTRNLNTTKGLANAALHNIGAINLKMEKLLHEKDDDSSESDFGDDDDLEIDEGDAKSSQSQSTHEDSTDEDVFVDDHDDRIREIFDTDDETAAASPEMKNLCIEAVAQVVATASAKAKKVERERLILKIPLKKHGNGKRRMGPRTTTDIASTVHCDPLNQLDTKILKGVIKRKRMRLSTTTTRSGRTVKSVMPNKSFSEESSQDGDPKLQDDDRPRRKYPKGEFSCATCGKQFCYHSQLRQHEQRHILKVCNEAGCHFEYKERSDILNHQINIHGKTKEEIAAARVYECPICKTGFKKSSELQVHRDTHDAAGKYGCPFCGKTFWYWQSRKAHKRSCDKKEPYDSSAASSQSLSQQSAESEDLEKEVKENINLSM